MIHLKEICSRKFSNGTVYMLETNDGYPVEVTDMFLPHYTKDAVGRKQNVVEDYELGNRHERWMIGISCMSGCPVGCKFCATGSLKKWRNLTAEEMCDQVNFVLGKNPRINPRTSKEFKINYTRMGEPFLNTIEVRYLVKILNIQYSDKIHHYISTIGIKDSDFSWIKNNITIQISLHSLYPDRRDWLIPYKKKMSIQELGRIRTESNLKTTVNLTLVDKKDFNISLLREYFDPERFFIKLSPINPNEVSEKNELGNGVVESINLV